MIDKGVPEIYQFQSDGIKNVSVQMQNEFHNFVDTKYKHILVSYDPIGWF